MDNNSIKDLIHALKVELIHFRWLVVSLFIAICLLALVAGVLWPKKYTTSALMVVDVTTIYEPLLKGRAAVTTIDRSEQAREVIYTRGILEIAARQASLLTANADIQEVDRVVRQIRNGLTVRTEKNNYFRIGYSASHPDTAFDTVNAVINVFIEDAARKKREESVGAYNFIDAQVQSYKKQLEQAEERLKNFTGQNLDGNENTVTQRIVQLRSEIEALTITIEETTTRISVLQKQLSNEGQYQQAKGQIDDLRSRRQTLVGHLESLLLVYQENYPDVISLRAQIRDLDTAISDLQNAGDVFANSNKIENPLYEELRKQQQAADVDLRAQQRRMESLLRLQEEEFERAQRVAANQAELSDLTRDTKVIREVYEEMLQRKESARVSMTLDIEGQGVSYRIQEPAAFPLKPSGLHFLHFAMLGPFLAAAIPLGLLLIYVIFDPRVRSARALQRQIPADLDVIGTIPHYATPSEEKSLRRDIVSLAIIVIVGIGLYIVFVLYWQLIRG